MPAILIVDDHAHYVQSLCRLLGAHLPTVELHSALDGSAALRLVHEHAFDLLILDYQLPVMTGTQLLRKLRARAASAGRLLPPVVVTSSQPDVGLYARTAGVEAFVPKPMLDEHVTSIIIPLLSRAEADTPRRPPLWNIQR
jgi:CheY-like chemotaxis protein